MAASNEQTWAASVLNMDKPGVKEFALNWHHAFRGYEAPGVTTEAGRRGDNALIKCRYADVKCVDQTRVILKNRQGDADFIHANWVGPAAPGGIQYICTQGPLTETMVDFFHMVYTESVSVIAMLSSFRQDDYSLPMCARYFPLRVGDWIVAGEYKVTCTKWLDGPTAEQCVCRQLEISRRGGETREVAHVHAAYWKDLCPPAETAPTLALRRWVHEQHGGRPVVVHGSAGVGRSMTFCAIDTAIARITKDPTFDMYTLTKELRAIRACAFQSVVNILYLKCLVLDALVDDKKIEPYGDSTFCKEYRRHTQLRHARAMARAIQRRNALPAEAA